MSVSRRIASGISGTPVFSKYPARRAFTIIELLVCVLVIAVLIALILPAMLASRELQRNNMCLSNMRQMHIGMTAYANDNKFYYPSPTAVGNFIYRQAPGKITLDASGSPLATALPETWGLNAILDSFSYINAASGIWLCPSANKTFRDFGNTYYWSINSVLTQYKIDDFVVKTPDTGLISEAPPLGLTPGYTGYSGPANTGTTWFKPGGAAYAATTSTTVQRLHALPGAGAAASQTANWLYSNGRIRPLWQGAGK